MIPKIAETLANLFAIETSLDGVDQIDFNPPSEKLTGKVDLNIYCYNYCYSGQNLSQKIDLAVDLAFVISTWNTPIWGEQPLLTEALSALQQHQQLELADRALALEVNAIPTIEPVVLWESLGVPMRPALYVTVKSA
jgi:hypothetical protein